MKDESSAKEENQQVLTLLRTPNHELPYLCNLRNLNSDP